MRLNNFSQNSFLDLKQQQNTKESIALEEDQTIQVQQIQNLLDKNIRFVQKDLLKSSNSRTKLQKLITQCSQTTQLSCIETLGIIILKIMAHQFVDHGYSSTKLNIIKSINNMQANNIYQKLMNAFSFKTSSRELMTILNNSVKIINKQLSQVGLGDNYLNSNKSVQHEHRCLKLHKIIMNHLRQFPICWQFFDIFIRMILLLVNYSTDKLSTQNIDATEIFFIICDYLGCKIEKKQSIFIIENVHFICFSKNLIQFGLIKSFIVKKGSNQTLKKNVQSRSANNLLRNNSRSIKQINYSTGDQQSSKAFSNCEKQGIKQQFYVEKLKIQKCISRLQMNCQKQIPNHSPISKSFKHQFNSQNNTISSVQIQNKNIFQNNHRKSVNFPRLKIIQKVDYKCKRCAIKKELTLQSNTVSLNAN